MDWDANLKNFGGHFLQSKAWLDFQESLAQKTFRISEKGYIWGGYVVNGRLGIRYLYVSYGPAVKSNEDLPDALKSMSEIARQQGCVFVRFDQTQNFPTNLLKENGCRYFGEVQPSYTHIISLEDDLSLIKSRMSKTNRNLINRSEKIGIKYSTSDDIPKFLDMMLGTAEYKHYRAKSRNYLEKQLSFLVKTKVVSIFMAEYEGKIVAGAVGADWDNTRYYIHAGGDQEVVRKIPVARGLAWHMIKDAKEKGLKEFDFYGVSELGVTNHKWANVSSFKRSFSGQDKDFGGTWDLPVNKAKYLFYKILKKITG